MIFRSFILFRIHSKPSPIHVSSHGAFLSSIAPLHPLSNGSPQQLITYYHPIPTVRKNKCLPLSDLRATPLRISFLWPMSTIPDSIRYGKLYSDGISRPFPPPSDMTEGRLGFDGGVHYAPTLPRTRVQAIPKRHLAAIHSTLK